jgi:hypothetical protein
MTDSESKESQGKMYGEVWLGDLLRALDLLTPAEVDREYQWLVELLGLAPPEMESVSEAPREIASDRESKKYPDLDSGQVETGSNASDTELSPEPGKAEDDKGWLPYDIVSTHHEKSAGEFPTWLARAEALPPADPVQATARPTLEPLLHPRWSRAILSSALATLQEDGPLDTDWLIEKMARCQPITALPRRRVPTLRLGIQLLLDRGNGMMPFARDQESLFQDILDLVGKDRVQQLRFADSPLRGNGPRSRFTWRRRYDPPQPGTPVVLLTDLGIARRRAPTVGADEAEWLEFTTLVRAADCSLLAFVPYAEHRWPPRLRQVMDIFQWDRSTTVSKVCEALRRR